MTSEQANEVVNRLLDAFLEEHPGYRQLQRQRLSGDLAGVYDAVVQGTYVAKTEEQLEGESRAAGIARNHYVDLVNMTAHAADDAGPIDRG
jgi:hypothetical protein